MPTHVINPSDRRARRPRFRFGPFVIDLATREILRDGALRTLSPKSFDCIAYLIENRERAVGRDELTAAIWGRADVTDAQLRQLMYRTRYAVSDSGGSQGVIRTIPHFGFHWVAELEECSGSRDSETPMPEAAVSPPTIPEQRRFALKATAWCSIILAILLAGGLIWKNRGFVEKAGSPQGANSSHAFIAVLPADIDAPGDINSDWMRLGLMDAIAKSLRKSSIDVIPSEEIAALFHNAGFARITADRVRDVTGALTVVEPFALYRGGRWTLRLDLDRGVSGRRSVEASSPDALLATHEASDRLLALFGRTPTSNAESSKRTSSVFLQRVDAALLIDDFDAARRLIETAPAPLRDIPELRLALARAILATGDRKVARGQLAALADTISLEEDPLLRGQILVAMGRADFDRPDLAVRELSDAIALLEPLDEPRYLGAAYNNRAIARTGQNRVHEAREDYARARVAFSLAGDSLGLARINNNDGVLEAALGRPAEALSLYQDAARTFERFGAVDMWANAVVNQMSAYIDLVRPSDALALYDRMRPRFEELGSRESHLFKIEGAAALLNNGQLRAARSLVQQLASAVDPSSESDLLMALGLNIAELDLAEGAPEAAIAHATNVVTGIRESRQFDGTRAKAWLVLVRALHDTQQIYAAQTQSRQFSEWAQASDAPKAKILASLATAEQQWLDGKQEQARNTYESGLRAAVRDGTPADIVTVASSYANALLDAGDYERASVVVGRAERWASADFDCALLQVRLYQAMGQAEPWRTMLTTAQSLAGERPIPVSLAQMPAIATTKQY